MQRHAARLAASCGARPVAAPMERFYILTIIKKRGCDLSIGAVTGTCLSAIVRKARGRENCIFTIACSGCRRLAASCGARPVAAPMERF